MPKLIVKVCGVTRASNMADIIGIGADMIGWIFHPDSPRDVSHTAETLKTVQRCGRQVVGVFVHQRTNEIIEICQSYRLDFAQLHGDYSEQECAQVSSVVPVIKVIRVANAKDMHSASSQTAATYVLFDTRSEAYGGTGKKFDWRLIESYTGDTPFLLSGGIKPGDAPDILQIEHPHLAGVDLNSGFESAPGVKDPTPLTSFIETLNHEEHVQGD